jgi:hypothetical protein
VEFAGKMYGTLTSVDPHNSPPTHNTCQGKNVYLPLPEGAILAPDTPDIRTNVVEKYGWSAHVLVLASGVGYWTGNDQFPGNIGKTWQPDMLLSSGDTYAVKACSLQILYERPAPEPTTAAAPTTVAATTTIATTAAWDGGD